MRITTVRFAAIPTSTKRHGAIRDRCARAVHSEEMRSLTKVWSRLAVVALPSLSLLTACGGDDSTTACSGSCGDGGLDATGADVATFDVAATDSSAADAESTDADAGVDGPSTIGCVDTSFGTGGFATFPVPPNGVPQSHGMALQADGKILVASGASVARYAADGTSLDTSYGNQGFSLLTPSGVTAMNLFALAVQADGKAVVVGQGTSGGTAAWVVTRLDAAGALDTGFGVGGYATAPTPQYGRGVALRPDGHIVIMGAANAGGYVITQLDSAGAVDVTFGTNGFTHTLPPPATVPAAIVLQPDGKALIGGSSTAGVGLARYATNGTLDTSFGNAGIAVAPVGPASSGTLLSLAIQSTGRIVAASTSVGVQHFFLSASRRRERSTPRSAREAGSTRTSPATSSQQVSQCFRTTASSLQAKRREAPMRAAPSTSRSPITPPRARSTRRSVRTD
jgi:uncharacterized delta-60 repeat protein